MKTKSIYMPVAWLTIALFTSVTILSFSGHVLCIGENNHIEVEPTGDSCCGFRAAHIETNDLLGDNQSRHGCGDCNDVDLDQVSLMRSLSRSADHLQAGVYTVLAWSFTNTPSADCTGNQTSLDQCSPALTQPQMSVSTTILIC